MEQAVFVDAFAGNGARGNLAAVVQFSAFPEDSELQAMARELEAPATAFLSQAAGPDVFHVRWFSPDREIALCGHGSLAAGHVALGQTQADRVTLHMADGRDLEILRLEGAGEYELALPVIATSPRDWPELTSALGAEPAEVFWNPAGYAIAVFEKPEDIAALAPDWAALRALGNIQLTVTAPGSLPGKAADVTCRVFSGGRKEDAATGSAHAALTPLWCARLGREQLASYQASERGGYFSCRLDGEQVRLGGQCIEVDALQAI